MDKSSDETGFVQLSEYGIDRERVVFVSTQEALKALVHEIVDKESAVVG